MIREDNQGKNQSEAIAPTSGKGFTPAPKVKPIAESTAIAPVTQPKRSQSAISSVEEANRKQQEAAASLATAGANAQTEFIEKVQEKATQLKSQVFTEEKIDKAARMLLQTQESAIDDVMNFLSRTTQGVAKQTIADIREASGVEVMDAELV